MQVKQLWPFCTLCQKAASRRFCGNGMTPKRQSDAIRTGCTCHPVLLNSDLDGSNRCLSLHATAVARSRYPRAALGLLTEFDVHKMSSFAKVQMQVRSAANSKPARCTASLQGSKPAAAFLLGTTKSPRRDTVKGKEYMLQSRTVCCAGQAISAMLSLSPVAAMGALSA